MEWQSGDNAIHAKSPAPRVWKHRSLWRLGDGRCCHAGNLTNLPQYFRLQCEHRRDIFTRNSMADTTPEKQTLSTESKSLAQDTRRKMEELSRRIILAITAVAVLSVPLFLLSLHFNVSIAETIFRSFGVFASIWCAPLYTYTGIRTANRTDLTCGLILGCTGAFWIWWVISN